MPVVMSMVAMMTVVRARVMRWTVRTTLRTSKAEMRLDVARHVVRTRTLAAMAAADLADSTKARVLNLLKLLTHGVYESTERSWQGLALDRS